MNKKIIFTLAFASVCATSSDDEEGYGRSERPRPSFAGSVSMDGGSTRPSIDGVLTGRTGVSTVRSLEHFPSLTAPDNLGTEPYDTTDDEQLEGRKNDDNTRFTRRKSSVYKRSGSSVTEWTTINELVERALPGFIGAADLEKFDFDGVSDIFNQALIMIKEGVDGDKKNNIEQLWNATVQKCWKRVTTAMQLMQHCDTIMQKAEKAGQDQLIINFFRNVGAAVNEAIFLLNDEYIKLSSNNVDEKDPAKVLALSAIQHLVDETSKITQSITSKVAGHEEELCKAKRDAAEEAKKAAAEEAAAESEKAAEVRSPLVLGDNSDEAEETLTSPKGSERKSRRPKALKGSGEAEAKSAESLKVRKMREKLEKAIAAEEAQDKAAKKAKKARSPKGSPKGSPKESKKSSPEAAAAAEDGRRSPLPFGHSGKDNTVIGNPTD